MKQYYTRKALTKEKLHAILHIEQCLMVKVIKGGEAQQELTEF